MRLTVPYETFVETMCKLAFNCPAFMFEIENETQTSSRSDRIIASSYFLIRKGKYKRVVREIRGQLMQITDRREQYYAKRKAHDERMNFLAAAYGANRPALLKSPIAANKP